MLFVLFQDTINGISSPKKRLIILLLSIEQIILNRKSRLTSSFWPKVILPAGAALAAFFIPTQEASAQPVKGLYIDGAAGASFNQGQELEKHGQKDGKELFKTGYMGKAAIGWGLGNGFRVEVEGNYRQNGISRFQHMQPHGLTASGHQRQYGVMTNALFDMDIGQNWVYPYFGAGIGYGWQQMDVNARQQGVPGRSHIGGTGGGFAYQGIFGLSFPVPWVVGLSTTLEYRFYTTTGRHRHSLSGNSLTPDVSWSAGNSTLESGHNFSTRTNFNHSLMWGLRYEFNAQPPQNYIKNSGALAALAPATTKEKSYLVFFDTNSAKLTPKAQDILEVAARDSSHTEATNIEVRDSSNDHNPKLAAKRAAAVQAILIRNGIPASQIGVDGTNGSGSSKKTVFEGHHVEITLN